jgi:dihydrolipoamide dehydrogenase
MTPLNFEVAVIGAGTAGLAAYRAAREAGRTAVIIEGGAYGTTCARVGCMPSKLLIAAAEAAHGVQLLAPFGLQLEGQLRVDGEAVMDRVRRERDRFVGFVLDAVEGIPAAHRLVGHARFTSPNTLLVDDAIEVHFARAVIATGSSPVVPPFLQGLGDRIVVNDDVFDWQTLPSSVAVFGPGVIGLELGQALHRLGVRVRLFGHGGIGGGLSDPQVREQAQRIFAEEYAIDVAAQVSQARRIDDEIEIRWTGSDGVAYCERFDYALAATGRAPNVRTLQLEKAGLALQKNGIPVYDRMTLQCGNTPIFIAGDANADSPLLHEAADEGRIAGTNAASFPRVSAGLRRSGLSVVFSDPQIAIVGQRFAEIDPAQRVIGAVSFDDQGRSRVMLRNRGLLRVYADRSSRRFLGAEMIGPAAEHLGHLLAWAHQAGMTIDTMLEMPFYHPVIEEGVRTALRNAATALDAGALPDNQLHPLHQTSHPLKRPA